MGGFEGGDEGGFWDEDAIETLIKKQNSSVKRSKQKIIIEIKDSVYSLKGDTYLSIVPQNCASFTIEGCEDIPLESNAIYKAYKTLIDLTCDSDIEEFFYEHKVYLTSEEPSSHSLNFLLLVKELCNLALSDAELSKISEEVV